MYTIIYNYTKKKSVRCLSITALCNIMNPVKNPLFLPGVLKEMEFSYGSEDGV